MSTLLTISQPPKTDFGGRHTYDFSPRISLAKSRVSPKPKADTPVSSLRDSTRPDSKMAAPHRGLPLPSAMGLPDPGRPPPSFSQSLGSMPAPPSQWHGQEESMRHWLSARAEEDKRKQEEQRTRQEELKLEQRKVEQSMLRESLDRGVPPTMVPMMYAGMGGLSLASTSVEMLQQYHAQLQAAQQQIQQQPSPEMRREQRLLSQGPQQQYPPPQHQPPQIVPSQPAEHSQPPQPSQGAPLQTTFPVYQSGPPTRPPPTSAPRSATHTQLPRLTTNEMYIQQPGQPQGPGSAHPLQQTQTIQQQDQPASSPSIYFHHWHPPNESKSTQPQTPASKGEPHSAHPGSSHLSESDYKDSPRKRKAPGPHHPAPPPSHTSPSFSVASAGSARKPGHARTRSNASTREPDGRRDAEPPKAASLSQQSSTDSARVRESPAARPEEARSSALEYHGERPGSRQSR